MGVLCVRWVIWATGAESGHWSGQGDMWLTRATEVTPDPVCQFASRTCALRSDNPGIGPAWLDRLQLRSPRRQIARDYARSCATTLHPLLCSRMHSRTALLTCHGALSRIRGSVLLAMVLNSSQRELGWWVCIPLMGRPSAKRNDLACRFGRRCGTGCSKPQQTRPFGSSSESRSAAQRDGAAHSGAFAHGLWPGRVGPNNPCPGTRQTSADGSERAAAADPVPSVVHPRCRGWRSIGWRPARQVQGGQSVGIVWPLTGAASGPV